jgi:serine/threonine-protein kinase RsbW
MPSLPAVQSSVNLHGDIPPALLAPGPEPQWQIFPGRASELARLRRWLARLLPGAPERDDVATIAVELAVNAIQHTASGRGGTFSVEIRWLAEPPAVRVTVADAGARAGPRWPRCAPGVVASGYGLYLVRSLASRTGTSGGRLGRSVWAEVAWTGPAAHCSPPGPGAVQRDG